MSFTAKRYDEDKWMAIAGKTSSQIGRWDGQSVATGERAAVCCATDAQIPQEEREDYNI